MRRNAFVAGLATATVAMVSGAFSTVAFSQANFPNKPVRFILAFGAPGGAPDVTARLIGPKLTEM
jgi:tripartite-type tricarboxylate transporter receptor subunit TctC